MFKLGDTVEAKIDDTDRRIKGMITNIRDTGDTVIYVVMDLITSIPHIIPVKKKEIVND